MMDSFVTGRQGSLLCKGKRVISQEDKKRRVDQVFIGQQNDLPDAGNYLVIVQGIYATSEPMAQGQPIVRAGCCGSALVQLAKNPRPQNGKSTSSKPSASSSQSTTDMKGGPGTGDSSTPMNSPPGSAASSSIRGEKVEFTFVNVGKIGGFMHWSDLREKTTNPSAPRLFCYADVADPLIDAGWEWPRLQENGSVPILRILLWTE